MCIILTVFKNFCFSFFLQKSLHHYYKLLLSLVRRLFFASFFSQNYQHHHFHIHIVSMRLVTQIFSYLCILEDQKQVVCISTSKTSKFVRIKSVGCQTTIMEWDFYIETVAQILDHLLLALEWLRLVVSRNFLRNNRQRAYFDYLFHI